MNNTMLSILKFNEITEYFRETTENGKNATLYINSIVFVLNYTVRK